MSLVTLAVLLPLVAAGEESALITYVSASADLQTLNMEGGKTELEMGDVNGDGHPDIVHVGDHGSPFVNSPQHGVTLWLGDGQGGFSLIQEGNFGYGGVALGDVDGDGFMDVGYGVHHNWAGGGDIGDQLIEVLRGNGTGSGWVAWDDGLATNGETWGMFGTDFADFDGDGDLDLGSTAFGSPAGLHFYRNNGNGTWTQSFGFTGGGSGLEFEFADFNGDGHFDAMTSHSVSSVYLGLGNGDFVAAEGNLPASSTSAPGTGDVDGDGTDELCFLSGGSPKVWSWGAGNQWVELTGNLPTGGGFQQTDLSDMNLDGRADLVVHGNGTLRIFERAANGTWSSLANFSVPGNGSRNGQALRAGVDLDHNGFPDLTLVQEGNSPPPIIFTRNFHHAYLQASSPEALAIRARAPSAGRTWHAGQVRFVDWTCAVPGANLGTVTLELSTSGPAGPWSPLAAGLANNGRHQVIVPGTVSSDQCHLRYTVATTSGSDQVVGPAFRIEVEGAPASYCTAGTTANACTAALSATGTASASASSGFAVSASGAEGAKQGLFFFGTNGRQANSWGNGTSFQCVLPPVQRAGLLTGSGTAGLCDGAFAQDLNARWCPTCPKPAHNPGAGALVQLQLWFRDPQNTSNQTTSLSNALEFTVAP